MLLSWVSMYRDTKPTSMEEREAGKQIQSLLLSYILNAGNLEGLNHWYCKSMKRS